MLTKNCTVCRCAAAGSQSNEPQREENVQPLCSSVRVHRFKSHRGAQSVQNPGWKYPTTIRRRGLFGARRCEAWPVEPNTAGTSVPSSSNPLQSGSSQCDSQDFLGESVADSCRMYSTACGQGWVS